MKPMLEEDEWYGAYLRILAAFNNDIALSILSPEARRSLAQTAAIALTVEQDLDRLG